MTSVRTAQAQPTPASPRWYHLRAVLTVAVVVALAPASALTQGSVSPSVHWGAQMLPDLTDRFDVSLSVVGFTQFGKDTVVDALGRTRYRFAPYNDMKQTLGLNLLSFVRTRTGGRFGEGEASVSAGPLTTRSTFSVGVIDDRFSEFLQNDFAHANRLRGRKLYDIPRSPQDVPGTDATPSTTRAVWPPVVSLAQEYFLRFYSSTQSDGEEVRLPTPFYMGGGWQVGTLNSEAFLDVGSNVAETAVPTRWQFGVLRKVGLGAAIRGGVVRPGHYFNDLTSSFVNIQMVGRLKTSVKGFPADIDYSLTSAHGFFVRKRDARELSLIEVYAPDRNVESRVEAKTGVSELFSSLRIRSGGFTFEVNNDSPGGKDKGPSFAAHIGYSIYKPGRRVPVIDRVLDILTRGQH